jgi:nucleotide-binding universal stress UspA family protein
MERALVVVDSSESNAELVREAGELAAGVGASLVVCSVVGRDEIDEYDEMIGSIERTERTSYGVDVREEAATKPARDVAEEGLGDAEVEYETTGIVADPDDCAPEIVDLATDLDCDHVFIAGRQRTPTGKAVFGDTAQRVILNFPHPVTIVTS